MFFRNDDYELYLELLLEWSGSAGMRVLSYCLMPNHVHVITVPPDERALTHVMSEVHRRYSKAINNRKGWIGHLWQGRYSSYPLDETHLYNAIRYVEMNPVNAGLSASPEGWEWSSAKSGACRYDLLSADTQTDEVFERHERTGRPLGDLPFLHRLEQLTGRIFVPKKPGRKKKEF